MCKLSAQLVVLILALALCSVWPTPELWTWLAAYGVAWLLLDHLFRSGRLGKGQSVTVAAQAWVVVALAALLAAPALAYLWRERDALARREGLRGAGAHLADRLWLEAAPSIFPPVVAGDRPQNLYVLAPDAERIELSLAPGVERLEGVALGSGLFRVGYDPRRHGVPDHDRARLDAAVHVDGQPAVRALRFVRWQPHPRWPCAAPDRGQAVVPSEETDEVFVVSRLGATAQSVSWQVGDGPTACAFVGDGLVAVSHRYDRRLLLVDPQTGERIAELTVGPFQVALAASHDGGTLAVARAGGEPEILLVSVTGGLESTEHIRLDERLDEHLAGGLAPAGVAFAGDDRLVVTSASHRAVFLLERAADGPGWRQSEIYLGRPPVAMAVSADGAALYVAATDFRPDAEEHRGNHFVQDQILRIDLDTRQVVDQYLTGRRSARQDRPGDVDSGVSPMGMAVRPDGDLLVAFAGSEEVWRLDADLRSPPRSASDDFDLVTPYGVADLGDGAWLATSPAGGCMAVYGDDGALIEFLSVSPKDDELAAAPAGSLLRQDLDLRSGERAFHEATRSGISCQSCHLWGGSDFAPHDIGQTPLLHTLTTRGVAGTAPYLRDGSFPRVRDLHFDLAQPLYRGYRRKLVRRPELLEGYVHALVAETNPALFEPRDLDLERAGLQAFVRASCDMCHALPAFTNLSRHPSRSLFPRHEASPTLFLDTPSLLAVHAKAHFLQDGRAESLDAVLSGHNKANRHGDTAILSDEERRALLHLLRSL